MKKVKKLVLFLMLVMLINVCVFLFPINENIAEADGVQPYWTEPVDPPVLQGWDLVDGGKHADWAGGTKYWPEWNAGVGVWNYQITVIRQDDFWSVKDFDLYDIYVVDPTLAGETWSTGHVRLNTYVMDNFSVEGKKHVIIHELGHVLGLDDYNGIPDVMNNPAPAVPMPYLTGYDMNAFVYLYNNVY